METTVNTKAIRSTAIWSALFLFLLIVAGAVRTKNPMLLSFIISFPFMLFWLMVIASVGRIQMRWWEALLGFVLFAVGWAVSALYGFAPGVMLLLLYAGAFLGYLVAAIIREPNLLLPVTIIAALVDFAMVYSPQGTTKTVIEHHHAVAKVISVGVGPLVSVGFGDFVFLGIFLTCVQKFAMNLKRTMFLLYSLLTLTFLFVLISPLVVKGGLDIPAIVPMAAAVVGANIRKFRLAREEWFAILYVGIIVLAAIALYLLTRHVGR